MYIIFCFFIIIILYNIWKWMGIFKAQMNLGIIYIYYYKEIRGGNMKYIFIFFIPVKILEMRMNLRMIKDENDKR